MLLKDSINIIGVSIHDPAILLHSGAINRSGNFLRLTCIGICRVGDDKGVLQELLPFSRVRFRLRATVGLNVGPVPRAYF